MQNHPTLLQLQPVLSWRSAISTIKKVQAGKFVGYGCTFRAVKDLQVAIVPIGYFEGFPRIASNHGAYVLIRGQRCTLIGRISMNMMTIDVSDVADVGENDVVTIIGQDGGETITASDFADWAETIHYEALTRLNALIPRTRV